ncbi:MAG TPA: glycosyl transferase family 2, partial [Nitrospirae bacterium]|nr:glycosyl transferase family 2 [Nitrospirota bacterium]
TRWDHINRDFSLFTGVQSLLLDGHFVIEHTARSRSGRFFNFNGTAGVWRKQALIDGGSWQYDTLTEDMDISYRVQLKGWKFIYLKDFPVLSELPVEMNAFKSQQHRWAKGSIQTAIKLLPTILRSPIPWKVKVESVFHLTNNSAYLFMIIVAALMFPSMIIRFGNGWIDTMFFDMPLLFMATLSIVMFYSMAQKDARGSWLSKIIRIPLLMGLGIGIAINNARAVIEALVGSDSEFKRTPKFAIQNKGDIWQGKIYRGEFNYTTIIEIAMALYFLFSLKLAIELKMYLSIPFLLLFIFGFSCVPAISLFQTAGRVFATRRGCGLHDIDIEEDSNTI